MVGGRPVTAAQGTAATLCADVEVALGGLRLSAALTAGAGEVVAVVGPNGAGKTTLLRALAGLVPLDRGQVTLGEAVLDDTATGAHLVPERRPVGVAFQDPFLFPHLSALDNVAYGLRARGARRAPARRAALAWLERVGVAEESDRRPRALSGGQARRVALARAMATEPALLLLDEPLSALDTAGRAEVRDLLRRRVGAQQGLVMVTHDPVDAMTLADRLVVLEDGRVTQAGAATEVMARPRTPWAARLVGLNLFRGRAEGGGLVLSEGVLLAAVTALRGPAFALVHPRAVVVHRARPEGSARNAWPGTVAGVQLESGRARVEIEGRPPVVAEMTPAAAADLRLDEGGPVWVSVKAGGVEVYLS